MPLNHHRACPFLPAAGIWGTIAPDRNQEAHLSRTHDVIVIGAGSAGLTAAGGCGRLGLRVALIERDRMGGECLNSGCVPSKALIASGRRAQAMKGRGLGIAAQRKPKVDFAGVRAHVQGAIEAIAPHDSASRFAGWGVEVIAGDARLTGPGTVEVGGRTLEAPRLVLAIGSRPALPPIEGLAETPFLTNQTLFDLEALPTHLLVLGAGPIGVEMAQAFRRLGAAVTLIEAGQALAGEEPDAAGLVLRTLAEEGVALRQHTKARRAAREADGVRLDLADGSSVSGSHLLVATGRQADTDGIGLALAGVRSGKDGILVDRRCRTSNPRIFAIGDCRAGPRFTHAAGDEGAVVVQNLGFGLPARSRNAAMPAVTYTEPELARIGLTERQARARYRRVRVHQEHFADNDRAVADGDTRGFAKVVRAAGRVVGVSIVGHGAGELIAPWSLVLDGKASLWSLSGAILPYPTRSEISRSVAFAAYEATIFGRWARGWARLRSWLRR